MMILIGLEKGIAEQCLAINAPKDLVLEFGPKDLRGIVTSHNDVLVIRAIVANYEIARVFINVGSSINILFKTDLKQMRLDEGGLKHIATPLFRFSGHTVHSLGQIQLPLSLREEPRCRTILTTFIVVAAPFVYNIILGRPSLSAF